MKTWLAITLVALAAIVVVLVVSFQGARMTPSGGASAALYEAGALGVRELPLELTDDSRATAANQDYAGAPSRTLSGSLYVPADTTGGPFPLIVYSHGFMSNADEARYYAEFLAPKGYVVAAVSYPLSRRDAPGGPNVYDVVNQPGDVSFIIDSLLAASADPADELHELIDPQRIGVAGLSLGGLTTTLVGFHRDLRDPRIRAAASIAGPASFFDRQFFRTADLPFLMIAGTSDAIVPYEPNAASIPMLDDEALLVTLEAGSHIGFVGQTAFVMRWFDHPDAVVCPMLVAKVGIEEGRAPEPLLAPDPVLGVTEMPLDALPCQGEYAGAMEPYEQLMLTRLALLAFFESAMAVDAERRAEMRAYLTEDFAAENARARVAASP